jgi:hypothetical protein
MTKVTQKKQYKADGILFDSYEEIHFYHWLQEARSAGMISAYSYHPRSFELAPPASVYVKKQLATKNKIVQKTLLQKVSYTPDFLLVATPMLQRVDHQLFSHNQSYWIDVKGTFGPYNDDAKFSVIRKWVWDKYGIFINKVVPLKFFEKTWVPRRAARTKTGKQSARYIHCKKIWDIPEAPQYPVPEVVPPPETKQDDLFQPESSGWSF